MTITGHVENGRIVLDEEVTLPEGAKVEIAFVNGTVKEETESRLLPHKTLYERMKPFIGSVEGLPTDFAINHDHYLHGQPKVQ